MIKTLINGGALAAPWGLALAPADFGIFSNDLLVGNFSFQESEINAFNPATGAFIGTIPIDVGLGNTPGGLWVWSRQRGRQRWQRNILYFNDGINGERDGLSRLFRFPNRLAAAACRCVEFALGRVRDRAAQSLSSSLMPIALQ